MPRLPVDPSSSNNPGDDDKDPVVAEYDIYITNDTIQRLLLQYPDRSKTKPFSTKTSQKPTSLRIKPTAGLVELDVPISTTLNYNQVKGYQYNESLRKSRILQTGGSLGLAGGFNTGPTSRVRAEDIDDDEINLRDIPRHDGLMDIDDPSSSSSEPRRQTLATQTLGGKIHPPTDGSPIYMLGAFRDTELHLSRLDHIVQLRTQLPHLDAMDEVSRSGGPPSSAAPAARRQPNASDPTTTTTSRPAAEPRAVDMKVKATITSGEAAGTDPSSTSALHTSALRTADLLRRMQEEKWERYAWVDEEDGRSWEKFDECMFNNERGVAQLRAKMGNREWLEGFSAPREGGKGLVERRRRTRPKKLGEKKGNVVEEEGEAGMAGDEEESGSEDSAVEEENGDGEGEDVEMANVVGNRQPGPSNTAADAAVTAKPTPKPAPKPTPKPRGRPRKSVAPAATASEDPKPS